MPRLSVAATLAALTAVTVSQSLENKYPTPFNSQIGALRFSIACKAAGIPVSLDGFFTGTAPISAAAGQPVAVSDITATVTIPKSLTQAGSFIGVAYANSHVFTNITATNASPSSLSAFPGGLWVNGTKFVRGEEVTLRVPQEGVLPPVGNFAGIQSGEVADFFVGELTADVYLYNAAGKQINKNPLAITCPPAAHPISIGGFNVQGPPNSTVFAPANGFEPDYPPLSENQEIGFFNVPYICDVGEFKGLSLPLFFGGVLFGSYPSGGTFSLPNVTSTLSVPQSLVSAAHQLYDAQTFESTVSDVQLYLSNASPSSMNIITTPVTATNQYVSSGGLKINIPTTGFLTAGPFTAGPEVNDYMSLSIGNATASLVLKNAAGQTTETLPVSCHPDGNLALYDILITAKKLF